jgi:hypothetical protein
VGKNSGLNGFGRDTAVTVNLYFGNYVLLPDGRGAEQEKDQQETEERSSPACTTL